MVISSRIIGARGDLRLVISIYGGELFMSGVFSPARAKIKERTLRTDKWWLQPLITFAVLFSFIIYATFRAFENANYFVEPLISPFYSPCLSQACIAGSTIAGFTPVSAHILNFALSPALIILIFPLGFRMTCYYYRKAYYRAFWLSPPACAVAEPHEKYTGETRAPLIFQNAHRWFFYAGLVFNVFLTYDAIISFKNAQGQWGHMSVGSLVLLVSSSLLWFYSLSCHTCRHTVGGRLKHFSKHPVRYKLWTWVSILNHKHQQFAWYSLAAVAFADIYVRQVASGAWTNFYFF
jgi:hypothetical protein